MIEPMKKVVLVVDNDAAILNSFKIRLEEKYELILVERGEEALHVFKQRSDFNLIIIDYRLPEMDGVTLFKKIRQENRVYPSFQLETPFKGANSKPRAKGNVPNTFRIYPTH